MQRCSDLKRLCEVLPPCAQVAQQYQQQSLTQASPLRPGYSVTPPLPAGTQQYSAAQVAIMRDNVYAKHR